jgi:hypothetical protein
MGPDIPNTAARPPSPTSPFGHKITQAVDAVLELTAARRRLRIVKM